MATSASCRVNYRQRSGSKGTTPLAVSLFAYLAYPATLLGRAAQKDTDDPPTSIARRTCKGRFPRNRRELSRVELPSHPQLLPPSIPIEIQLFQGDDPRFRDSEVPLAGWNQLSKQITLHEFPDTDHDDILATGTAVDQIAESIAKRLTDV